MPRVLIPALWLPLFLAAMVLAADRSSADRLFGEGLTAIRNGSFPQAVLRLTEAAGGYQQNGRPREHIQALIHLSQALQQVGSYREAGGVLRTALGLAEELGDRTLVAAILGRLGTLYFALGHDQKAEEALNNALITARDIRQSALTASLLNDLGNVLSSQRKYAQAAEAYGESRTLALSAGDKALAVRALINAAKMATRSGRTGEARPQLDQAGQDIPALDDSFDKAFAWLSLGIAYEELLPKIVIEKSKKGNNLHIGQGNRGVQVRPESDAPIRTPDAFQGAPSEIQPLMTEGVLTQSAVAFWSAVKLSEELGDPRTMSYGWGYLGHLYEREARVDESLALTRRAVLAAQQVHAPESLYRWQWQTGRLLLAQNKPDEAITAYQRALQTLQPIRQELVVGIRERDVSFRESTGRLYFELSDLLLRRATLTKTRDPDRSRALLLQAQGTLESFKAAELQDYFQDGCVAAARARSTPVAEATRSTAVIYPIVLPDRLELLVSLPDGLQQFVVPVTADTLTAEVHAFRLALEDRSRQDHLRHARTLYDWLVRPLQPELERAGVSTLVFVPDGALRTIPIAPLHDGKDYLVSKYAVAVTPGLTLTDPRPINRSYVKLLSAGLSESVQGFPALPNVTEELGAIHTLYGGELLLNDRFRVSALQQELKDEPFTILHIASHGTVQRDVRDSYILAFDDKITMDRLTELVGLFEYRDSPLELLTLSACQTAAGDDRAALGLAGIAIKAGARSALATLWFIDDAATSDLMVEFYRQLQNPALSKATALQQAQLHILKDPQRQHPSYWAPFLLINNWL